MDSREIICVLKMLKGASIRVPTACWLFSDLYNVLDSEVRLALNELVNGGMIRIDNGGWITLTFMV